MIRPRHTDAVVDANRSAVVWNRRRIFYGVASRDTMGQEHAGNVKQELPDGTQAVVERAINQERSRTTE